MRTCILVYALSLGAPAHAATLEEILDAARAYAPDQQVAEAVQARADATNRLGRSRLAPFLTGDARYTLNNYAVVFDTEDGEVVVQPLHYGDASAALTVPFSPSAVAAQRAQERLADAAENDRLADERRVVLEVVRAYYGLLVAQEAIDVQRDLLDLARAQEALATTRLDVGMSDDRAVLRAQLATSRAQRELEAARTAQVAAVEALATLTGREETETLVWPDAPVMTDDAPVSRPELAAAADRVDAASRRVRGAWTQWMPGLGASLTYQWTGNAGFAPRNDLLTGAVAATWTLPTSGTYVYQRRVWQADARIAAAELRRTEDAVARRITTARAEHTRSVAAADAVQRELELADRHHALTVRAFELGTASALEVDDAQGQLRAVRLSALRERASVDVAAFAVAWAEGRLALD